MIDVDFSTFNVEVLEESFYRLVVVDFWAPWCSPCLTLKKTIEKVEKEGQFPVKYTQVNVDEHTDLALHFKVMGVPNVKFFFGGRAMDEFSENIGEVEFKALIHKNILTSLILKRLELENSDADLAIERLEEYCENNRSQAAPFLIPLIKYYLAVDLERSKFLTSRLHSHPEYMEDYLYLQDLFKLVELEFEEEPVHQKLWAARNSLLRRDFDATYQFLLQAHKIHAEYLEHLPKFALLAFRYYLEDHPLNDKYSDQLSRLSD